MRSDSFGCVRMHLDAFRCIPTTSENFWEIHWKKQVFRKFCEVSEGFGGFGRFCVPFCRVFVICMVLWGFGGVWAVLVGPDGLCSSVRFGSFGSVRVGSGGDE